MEVTREPSLDASVFTDKFNELSALGFIGMVQPAASIDNMVLLQHTKTTSIRRGMGEDKDLPAIISRVVLDNLLKPVNLVLVNSDLMGGVLDITENSGSHTYQKGLFRNFTVELRSWLSMSFQEHLKVSLISVKLINTLQICGLPVKQKQREIDVSFDLCSIRIGKNTPTVVSANDLVWNAERSKELGSQFMALSGTGEKLIGFIGAHRLGLSQVSQRNESDIVAGVVFLMILEDVQPLVTSGLVIFHVSWIDVKISEDSNAKLVRLGVMFQFWTACHQGTTIEAERRRGSSDKGVGRRRKKSDGEQGNSHGESLRDSLRFVQVQNAFGSSSSSTERSRAVL